MRVLLINPPSPERLGAPLLGLQYVAAALIEHGCEVKVVDAAARYFDRGFDSIVAESERFAPDLTGFGLFTRWVWHAYALAERLKPFTRLMVAGGAHTTVRPDEVLDHGFDIAVTGEAEATIVRLIDYLRGREALESIAGIRFRRSDGSIGAGPKGEFIQDLDALASPHLAQSLFDPRWYHPSGVEVIPGGIITSRGCPARCTFCANYVTGRGFRHRSSASVTAEINAYHARTAAIFFPFWDDAITANQPRLRELCDAFERDVDFPLGWSAITRANMVTQDLLNKMKGAGCVSVNFGVESGDDQILRVIKKGVSTAHVVRALEWAKDAGLRTACNFMLGFPQETPRELENTLTFMQRIAPLVDSFSTLGVVVPFPGTPLYGDFHVQYGFTGWWLREDYSQYSAAPPSDDFDRFYRHYIDDANLELNFFRYNAPVKAMIRECMKFKGEHNLRKMGLLRDPVFAPEPVGV